MKLFQLHPYGIGSSEVESVSSFLIRLATLHGLSVNELRVLTLNRYSEQPGFSDERVRSNSAIQALSHLVRPTRFTRQLVEQLTEATQQRRIASMTFLPLGDEFGRQKGVFKTDIAWCPLCFSEQAELDQAPHLQLIWSIRDYRTCHLHKCELIERCAHCQSKQNSCRFRRSIGQCVSCGVSLVGLGASRPKRGSEGIYYQDLVGLVAGINENPNQLLSQKAAQNCVDELFSEVWRREEEKRLWDMLPRDECISIVCGEKELTLPVLRRVAYRLGVDLYQILAGRLQPVTQVLDPGWLAELPDNLKPRPKRPRICRKELLQHLRSARNSKDGPQPLKAIAKAAGTSTGAIEYHFPSFAEEVKSAYQQELSKRRQRKEELGRVLIFKFLAHSDRRSRKAAQRYLASESDLSKNQIRALVAKYVPPATKTGQLGP